MSKHGIFNFGAADPVETARKVAEVRIQAERRKSLAGLSGLLRPGALQSGFGAGALGGALVNKITGKDVKAVDSAPEVTAAQNNASLLESIQGLAKGDTALTPGTSQFMAAAGKAAQEAGRTDLALQFATQAATLRTNEAALAAKIKKETAATEQAAFNGLPNAVKLSVTANNPDRVQRAFGLSKEETAAVAADAQDTLRTLQAKNQKALDELKAVSTTKSSPADITQTEALLSSKGVGGFSFEGNFGKDDPERFTAFATLMDQQATAEIDAAARKGDRLSKADIYDQILAELNQDAGIEGFGTDDVTGIDLEKLSTIFKARSAVNQIDTAKPRRRVVVSP